MTQLAEELRKYYVKQGNRFLFSNGQSLNQLALALWNHLGCQQVDASVLSRVLNGRRLFTVSQLHAFCELLGVSSREATTLEQCLRRDRNAMFGLAQDGILIPSSLAQQTMCSLADNSVKSFYSGDYRSLGSNYELMEQLVEVGQKSIMSNKASAEAAGVGLYVLGRVLSSSELPSVVLGKIKPIFVQLIAMSDQIQSALLCGYAHILLANAYYGAGGYSSLSAKSKYYTLAIRHAKKAIDMLPVDDHERLFAYRTMAASANYIGDEQCILYVLRQLKQDMATQPQENYVNGLHLSMTLSKSLATFGSSNPFSISDLAEAHFSRNLSNTGAYEASGIRETIETMLALGSQDTTYIQKKAQSGLLLATDYKLSRHAKYFSQILRTV